MTTHHLPGGQCPACAGDLSGATNLQGVDPPAAGDHTVCIYCGQVLRLVAAVEAVPAAAAGREWRPALALAMVSDDELRALWYVEPKLAARLLAVRGVILEVRARQRARRN